MRKIGPFPEQATSKRSGSMAFVIAAFLIKLSKHMALLACFLIVGTATGRATISQLGIFFLIVTAAVIYSIGRSLERRSPALIRLPRHGP
jgi:hypothetical protein